jgi:hypothetical protein
MVRELENAQWSIAINAIVLICLLVAFWTT